MLRKLTQTVLAGSLFLSSVVHAECRDYARWFWGQNDVTGVVESYEVGSEHSFLKGRSTLYDKSLHLIAALEKGLSAEEDLGLRDLEGLLKESRKGPHPNLLPFNFSVDGKPILPSHIHTASNAWAGYALALHPEGLESARQIGEALRELRGPLGSLGLGVGREKVYGAEANIAAYRFFDALAARDPSFRGDRDAVWQSLLRDYVHPHQKVMQQGIGDEVIASDVLLLMSMELLNRPDNDPKKKEYVRLAHEFMNYVIVKENGFMKLLGEQADWAAGISQYGKHFRARSGDTINYEFTGQLMMVAKKLYEETGDSTFDLFRYSLETSFARAAGVKGADGCYVLATNKDDTTPHNELLRVGSFGATFWQVVDGFGVKRDFEKEGYSVPVVGF